MKRLLAIFAGLGLAACSEPPPGADVDAPAAGSQTAPAEASGVRVGTLADSVLSMRGKAAEVVPVGSDGYGLRVEWRYPDATYVMGRRDSGGANAYRVIEIR